MAYDCRHNENEPLVIGGYIAAIVLLLLVLARLVITNQENARLFRVLRDAYDSLEEKNRKAIDRAARLEQLNDELQAVQDELIRSNRELVASESLWERLAVTDTLTELANRRAFQKRLREEVARAQRYSYPFMLLMLDVDEFKSYNDTLGHPAGDQILRAIAGVMRDNVREGDLVARYGGEEFAALLPQTDAHHGRFVAERIRNAVEHYPFPHRKITVSIGGAQFAVDGTEVDSLIDGADRALYFAKGAGRNRVVFVQDIFSAD